MSIGHPPTARRAHRTLLRGCPRLSNVSRERSSPIADAQPSDTMNSLLTSMSTRHTPRSWVSNPATRTGPETVSSPCPKAYRDRDVREERRPPPLRSSAASMRRILRCRTHRVTGVPFPQPRVTSHTVPNCGQQISPWPSVDAGAVKLPHPPVFPVRAAPRYPAAPGEPSFS